MLLLFTFALALILGDLVKIFWEPSIAPFRRPMC